MGGHDRDKTEMSHSENSGSPISGVTGLSSQMPSSPAIITQTKKIAFSSGLFNDDDDDGVSFWTGSL